MGVSATRALLIAAGACSLAAVAAVADPRLWPVVIGLDAIVVAAALADLAASWRRLAVVRVETLCGRTWSRDRPETVRYAVEVHSRFGIRLAIVPDLPRLCTVEPAQRDERIGGRQRAEIEFKVTARRRGRFPAAGLHVETASRLGLWRLTRRIGDPLEIHVHPDLKQLGDYALLARTDRLSLIGVRRARRVGGDTEFERLRDYHGDDPLNRMDWKATARRDHLTVRDYQISQSQSIVLMIDAGRMMTALSGGGDGRSLLDHAIDAALMLSWVALRQNDRVGTIAYADGIDRYVPPGGGPRMLNQLVHALHDLEARMVESRHEDAFLHLGRRLRKRSLVVVLTHLLDEVNADHLERHCAQLVGRHLPMVVLLQDHGLHDAVPPADRPFAGDTAAFWRAGAAASILVWRQGLIERLQAKGCLVIDTAPEKLTAALISRYLEIKARHLL
jgi:uncharacterized protein (DUF58 family)